MTFTGPPPKVRVDANVQVNFGRQQLLIDDHAVHWKGESIPHDSLTSVAYWVLIAAGIPQYRIKLSTGEKNTTILFSGDEKARSVYDRAIDVLAERAGARLARNLLARITAGEQLKVAGCRLDRTGLSRKFIRERRIPWSSYVGVEPIPRQAALSVLVSHPRSGQKKFGVIHMGKPNAPLLPGLFQICAREFGSAAAS